MCPPPLRAVAHHMPHRRTEVHRMDATAMIATISGIWFSTRSRPRLKDRTKERTVNATFAPVGPATIGF